MFADTLNDLLLRQAPEGGRLLGMRARTEIVASVAAGGFDNFTFLPEEDYHAALAYHIDFIHVLPGFFSLTAIVGGDNLFDGLMDEVTTEQGLDCAVWVTRAQPLQIQVTNQDTKRSHFYEHIVRYLTVANQRYYDLAKQAIITVTGGETKEKDRFADILTT